MRLNRGVLCLADGAQITRDCVIKASRAAQRVAHTRVEGVHMLRHTFWSHLAMRGAAARPIQKVVGHADLTMTQRYMRLSPSAIEDAIRYSTIGLWASRVERVWKRGPHSLELQELQRVSGAGYGDRTRVRGLGSLCTTIVLSPLLTTNN